MSYNPIIPQPNDAKNLSQPQILENFGQISATFSVDHETFSSNNGQGKHKQITLPVLALGNPNPGEVLLYANTGVTGNPELFIRKNGFITPIEATSSNRATQGWTSTPSGLIIKWGSATIASAAGGPFNFPWPVGGNNIAFGANKQFWAIVQVGSDPGNTAKDVNAICYITDLSDPTLVEYVVWRRNQFNTPGTDQQPFSVWVMALGAP